MSRLQSEKDYNIDKQSLREAFVNSKKIKEPKKKDPVKKETVKKDPAKKETVKKDPEVSKDTVAPKLIINDKFVVNKANYQITGEVSDKGSGKIYVKVKDGNTENYIDVKDGKFVITPIGDKIFVGKDIIHAAVWKKNDEHMVYNVIYRDGDSGICYGKRFAVISIIREKEYDMTQGSKQSVIIYFTANPNSESEMVTVNLHSSVKARKKVFDFNFSKLAIKGRSVKGNIISKYHIRKVVQKELGDSTLGGRDIWIDENIGRLNTDKQGRYLGSFNTGESILVIYEGGSYELTDFELTNRYKLNEIDMIEKFNTENIITAVHFEGGSRNYYVKRFQVETTTTGRRFSFVSANRGSKLVLVSTDEKPLLEFSYRTKRGDKKSKQKNLVDFVEMKGWKAMGNKLGNYLRMSGFKWLEENDEKSEILEERDNTELTLFN